MVTGVKGREAAHPTARAMRVRHSRAFARSIRSGRGTTGATMTDFSHGTTVSPAGVWGGGLGQEVHRTVK